MLNTVEFPQSRLREIEREIEREREKPSLPAHARPLERVRVRHREDGLLMALLPGLVIPEPVPVRVVPCFPWTGPGRFISLVDKSGKEVALVREPVELDPESRRALERALAEAGFTLEIEKIHSIREEYQLRVWKVETTSGQRQLQTELDDWPVVLPGGALLIRDVAGDLFKIARPHELDEESSRVLWPFID